MQIKNKLGIEFKMDQRVDSPGDAGIASYRQAFFSPEYVAKYPDRNFVYRDHEILFFEKLQIFRHQNIEIFKTDYPGTA